MGEEELPHCRSGAWFVDLTAVSTGAEVPGAIANGLGLNLVSGDATSQILAFLGDKQVLVSTFLNSGGKTWPWMSNQ